MDGIGAAPSVGAGNSGGIQGPSQGLDQQIQQLREKIQAKSGEGSKIPVPVVPVALKGREALRVPMAPKALVGMRVLKSCSKNW